MGIELRMPNINGNEKEQLVQIRSYLYQLIPQLQWALNNVNATELSSGAVNQIAKQIGSMAVSGSGGTTVGAEVSFERIKELIIKSSDIVEAYYEEINKKLSGLYVAESDFGTFVQETKANITATSTYTDQQFSNVQVIFNDKIDGLKVTYQEDINNLNTSFNNTLDSRISEEVAALNSSIADTNQEIGNVNSRVDSTNISIGKANERITQTDARIDEVDGQIVGINNSVANVEELAAGLNESVVNAESAIKDTNVKVDETSGDVANLKAAVEDTSDKVANLNADIEAAKDGIKDLNIIVYETFANTRAGLLDDKAVPPVYGFEVGQRNLVNGVEVFDKYARFTADRLSFYDQNDTETAYISDDKLYIRNAEIKVSSQEGGYKDFIDANGGIVTKWVGGDN